MFSTTPKLKESLDNIKMRIRSAAERSFRSYGAHAHASLSSDRNPDEIIVVAVTKTVGIETLKALSDLGWPDIGENRVNDALDKARALSAIPLRRDGMIQPLHAKSQRSPDYFGAGDGFTWHMIGHLQSNKAKKAVGLFDYIHSLDSILLAKELQKEALKINKTVRVLIQVNVSNEATKSGIKHEELSAFYKSIKEIISPSAGAGLIISGLMTMAPITNNPETVRPYFRKLRELRDKLKNDFIGNNNSEELKYLSMGMSQDFEVAVEEGANMLRIGTAIFNSANK